MAERRRVPDFQRKWTVVALRGSLDDATVEQIEQEIRQLGNAGGRLIVEVSDLHFLDGFGVDVLVLLAQRTQRQGGLMALVDRRGHIGRVLGEAGLEGLLPLFATVAEAVLGLSEGSC